MNSTNSLNMALRDAVGHDASAGIMLRAMLKVEELDQ